MACRGDTLRKAKYLMPAEKILLVNDEEDILKVMADRLEFYGFQVCAARNGAECLERVDAEVPNLVLLDVRMPGMGGLEVLDELHRRYPELPVLMISASADREMVEESLSRGAVDYLLKPFEPARLKEKVFQALKKEIP